jgi:hypothetical protein
MNTMTCMGSVKNFYKGTWSVPQYLQARVGVEPLVTMTYMQLGSENGSENPKWCTDDCSMLVTWLRDTMDYVLWYTSIYLSCVLCCLRLHVSLWSFRCLMYFVRSAVNLSFVFLPTHLQLAYSPNAGMPSRDATVCPCTFLPGYLIDENIGRYVFYQTFLLVVHIKTQYRSVKRYQNKTTVALSCHLLVYLST